MSYLDSPDIDWIDAQVHTRTLDYASIACVFAYVSLYLTLTLSWKTLKNNDPLFVLYVLLLLACMLKNMQKLFIKEEPSSELKSRHKDKI